MRRVLPSLSILPPSNVENHLNFNIAVAEGISLVGLLYVKAEVRRDLTAGGGTSCPWRVRDLLKSEQENGRLVRGSSRAGFTRDGGDSPLAGGNAVCCCFGSECYGGGWEGAAACSAAAGRERSRGYRELIQSSRVQEAAPAF